MISAIIRLTERLRPELKNLEGFERALMIVETTIPLSYFPFVIAGIVWLVTATSWEMIAANWGALLAFALLLLFVDARPITAPVKMGNNFELPISLSLTSVLVWSGLLTFGASFLWPSLAVHIASQAPRIWRARRLGQPEWVWGPLSAFLQSSIEILYSLIGLAFFFWLGGAVPFDGMNVMHWAYALLAMGLADVLLPTLLLFPNLQLLKKLHPAGSGLYPQVLFHILFTGTALPFSLIGPLLFAGGGSFYLIFFGVAMAAVALLAHFLSRSNLRSRQQARELASLEALGEEIVRADPGGESLHLLLEKYLPQMLPYDIVEITLADSPACEASLGAPFTVRHHPLGRRVTIPDPLWERLDAVANDDQLLVEAVTLPQTTAVYGDAVLVKITAIDEEPLSGSDTPATIGRVGLLRSRAQGKAAESQAALQALASQISSAVFRARSHAEALAYQRTARELEIAGEIQASFLPKRSPKIPGWEISGSIISARETSGDFFDFIDLKNGRWGFVVADVADKGTGAALYMALSRTLIRTYAHQYPDEPAAALREVNERILADTEAEQFVTVFYGVLDPAGGCFTYASAGHNPGLFLSGGENGRLAELGNTGIPLGMFEEMAWRQETITFQPGDVLFLYTDGLVEAPNEEREEFGLDRTIATLENQRHQPAAALRDAILDAHRTFVGPAEPFDDITLMVIRRQLTANSQ